MKNLQPEKLSKLVSRFSITNIENVFYLNFFPTPPIDFILTPGVIEKYNKIFKLLFQFNTFQLLGSKIYATLKLCKSGNDRKFNKICKNINCSLNLLKSIQTFLFNEIIEVEWRELYNFIEETADIYELIQKQNLFLNNLIKVMTLPLLNFVNKLQIKLSQFYLKSCLFDFFDYENCKEDPDFINIVEKIGKHNERIKTMIINDSIIGEFHNLKYYL